MRIKPFILFLLILFILSGCGQNKKPTTGDGIKTAIKYAEGFTMTSYGDYTRIDILNPWDSTGTLHTYIAIPKDSPVPEQLPVGTVLRIPLTNTVIYSSVHTGILQELGALEQIGGICDLRYSNQPAILERCTAGKITDAGNSMNPDIEKIIDMNPDAILLSPFENSGYGPIEKTGIPLVECADYMETSPLGRAEWIKLFGFLYGKETAADSLFSRIEQEYTDLQKQAQNSSGTPSVFSEMKSGSAWYVPGGKSYMARIFADAGANYIWNRNQQSGSFPLSFEVVFDQAHDADFWLIKYYQDKDKTYNEIKKDYAPYANFKAFQKKNIYGCNTAKIPYYEEFPFHPERLLKDLIKIFHPELLPGYQPEYFTPLSE